MTWRRRSVSGGPIVGMPPSGRAEWTKSSAITLLRHLTREPRKRVAGSRFSSPSQTDRMVRPAVFFLPKQFEAGIAIQIGQIYLRVNVAQDALMDRLARELGN